MAAKKVEKVTVLGAGVLGAQIAFQAAYAGFPVVSYDIDDDAVEAAKKRYESIKRSYLLHLDSATEEAVDAARERVTLTSDLEEAVSSADLIIEAVPEVLELKREFWEKVGKIAGPDTLFATNTSRLRPSDFADSSGAPERFVALHFANRLWTQRLAELMPTPKTDDDVVDAVEDYAKRMDMVPIVLRKEHPAYLLNTLLGNLVTAGVQLWIDGIADYRDIDRDWHLGHGDPHGPFRIMDIIGLRTILNSTRTNPGIRDAEWGREFARRLQEDFIDKGKLGVETGEGFYKYDEDGNPLNW
ncbi:3-hydroxyacyl-CoA dehydrogenase [Corynebacterium otitidis]|uniref:3-hydroxyacyl-CoA dehydrogenase n=1 Tax=Corynebacterium otitidis TaxID=29321 RepID=UPI0006281046|nr:3-hydroxyacyl-CoA dehydrogenase [Corynebacterium otitidis]KKO83084.1 3-hydroxybutyryl-CoA dehydrogenase [Corynebacterium otitidis]